MTDFTTYKTATGEITSCGSTNVALNEIATLTGESVIEGIYEAEKYKIINGSAVEQTIDWKKSLRRQRNVLLAESDWTQMSDSPLTDSKKTEWATYRQTLRDLPAQYGASDTMADVTFPTEPS
tara:strand:+ start:682 stop:1050 length:369 start_codon:yes stop_codon:yes gene_type:complete